MSIDTQEHALAEARKRNLQADLDDWAKNEESVPDFWDETCASESIAIYLESRGYRKFSDAYQIACDAMDEEAERENEVNRMMGFESEIPGADRKQDV